MILSLSNSKRIDKKRSMWYNYRRGDLYKKQNTKFYNSIIWQVDQTLIYPLMILSAPVNFDLCNIRYDDAFLKGIAYSSVYIVPANFNLFFTWFGHLFVCQITAFLITRLSSHTIEKHKLIISHGFMNCPRLNWHLVPTVGGLDAKHSQIYGRT